MYLRITMALLLISLALSSRPPCNPNDPKSLCLTSLKRIAKHPSVLPDDSTTLRRGSGGGGRGSSSGSRGGSRGGRARRPRRGSRRPGSDDDEDNTSEPDDDDEECFPETAVVTVAGKGRVEMRDLAVGDAVQTASGLFSKVFFFGHRVTNGYFSFVRIHTENGYVTLSAGHYVYVGDQLVTARSVKIGDVVEGKDGEKGVVTDIETVREKGLYNPHTVQGELLVDGFRVSAYTEAVKPSLGELMLVPVRAAFRILGIDITAGSMEASVPMLFGKSLARGHEKIQL